MDDRTVTTPDLGKSDMYIRGYLAAKKDAAETTKTRDGRTVHILKKNARGKYPIVALYEEKVGYDMVHLLTSTGEFWIGGVHVPTNDVIVK